MGLFEKTIQRAQSAASDIAQRHAPIAEKAKDAAATAYLAVDEKSGGLLSETAARATQRRSGDGQAGGDSEGVAARDGLQEALAKVEPEEVESGALPDAPELKMPNQGRAWIADGVFHYQRGFGVFGRASAAVPVDAIESVVVDGTVQEYLSNGKLFTFRILGAEGELARVGNLMPHPAQALDSYLVRYLELTRPPAASR